MLPPIFNRGYGKFSGIMGDTYRHTSFLHRRIIDAVGIGFAQLFIKKIMHLHFDGLFADLPGPASILVVVKYPNYSPGRCIVYFSRRLNSQVGEKRSR